MKFKTCIQESIERSAKKRLKTILRLSARSLRIWQYRKIWRSCVAALNSRRKNYRMTALNTFKYETTNNLEHNIYAGHTTKSHMWMGI